MRQQQSPVGGWRFALIVGYSLIWQWRTAVFACFPGGPGCCTPTVGRCSPAAPLCPGAPHVPYSSYSAEGSESSSYGRYGGHSGGGYGSSSSGYSSGGYESPSGGYGSSFSGLGGNRNVDKSDNYGGGSSYGNTGGYGGSTSPYAAPYLINGPAPYSEQESLYGNYVSHPSGGIAGPGYPPLAPSLPVGTPFLPAAHYPPSDALYIPPNMGGQQYGVPYAKSLDDFEQAGNGYTEIGRGSAYQIPPFPPQGRPYTARQRKAEKSTKRSPVSVAIAEVSSTKNISKEAGGKKKQ